MTTEPDAIESLPPSSDDSSYLVSDEDTSPHGINERLEYGTSTAQNVLYFSNKLSEAMESIQLDKSLVAQAQLSGKLNNENQKLIDKQQEVIDRLKTIESLYSKYFASDKQSASIKGNVSRIERLRNEINQIESRIDKLKYGTGTSGFRLFRTNSTGIVQKYPIEYNKAKDKVLERQMDFE